MPISLPKACLDYNLNLVTYHVSFCISQFLQFGVECLDNLSSSLTMKLMIVLLLIAISSLDRAFGKQLQCVTDGSSFRGRLELDNPHSGIIRIQDPKPADRITKCKIKLKWLKPSGQNKYFAEYSRGICSPERPFEKTHLFSQVMVWYERLPRTESIRVKMQFNKIGGVEECFLKYYSPDFLSDKAFASSSLKN